ncbi:MAG: Blue-light-activated protein [Bryobacterales bacterium]|nr:Blue-light-activated protein [Bryobacterales bacterium]
MLLIVDDEPNLLDLLRRYLGRLGYEVETCGDANDALALFRAGPDRFSLAITDLSLPALNGEELIDRIRQLRPGLPAIITSGYPYQPKAAGVAFLQKPFLPQMLVEAVQKALAGAA